MLPAPVHRLRRRARIVAAVLLGAAACAAWMPGTAAATGPTHVVGTFDGSTLRLYLNGREATRQRASLKPGTATAVEIGTFLAGDVLNGVIDEVAVYRRPLSAAIIQTHYRVGSGAQRGRYSTLVSRDRGLISYWRLGERSGTRAADTRGRNNGSYRDGSHLGVNGLLSGDPDRALQLDGNGGGVLITHTSGLSPSGGFTLEAWVNAQDNRDATIFSGLNCCFLKTNQRGQWGVGAARGKTIASVYTSQKASNVDAPPPAPAGTTTAPTNVPATGKDSGGGIGAGTIAIGVLILVAVIIGVRWLFFAPPEEEAEDEERRPEEFEEPPSTRRGAPRDTASVAARARTHPRPPARRALDTDPGEEDDADED